MDQYIKPVLEATIKHNEKRESWIKSILLLSSSLFGILISLHNTNSPSLYARYCFVLSVALLALGILMLSISLFGFVDVLSRHRADVLRESQNALEEHRSFGTVLTKERKIFSVCEKIGYIALVSCVISLVVYAYFIVLAPKGGFAPLNWSYQLWK